MSRAPIGVPVTLRLVNFAGGWNSSDSPSLLSLGEAKKADNVSYDMRGTLSPRKGRNKRFANPIANSSVTGLAAITRKDGVTKLLIITGSDLYTDKPYMESRWDSQADWKKAGTSLEGDATADRIAGSLALSNLPAKRNETQKVTIGGSPTGGTFTLTLSGQTTAAIAYNATAAAVQSALEALSNIEVGDVTVTGADGGPWSVEFKGQYQYKDVADMTATSSLTGGTSPSVAVTVEATAIDLTAVHAYDTDEQLGTGTLDKVAVTGGKAVLTRKGTDYTRTFDTQADWDAGTMTNMDSASTPGDIKLAVERAAVNQVRTSQADFNLGTHSSTSTTILSGSVTLART